MTTLLSRVAENIYWASRYLERAEDTARIVRSYTDAMADMPAAVTSSWEPLLAIAGSRALYDEGHVRVEEGDIVRFLVADPGNPGSVCSCVTAAREDLRSTREIVPADAWHAVNDLYLYVSSHREGGVDRRTRSRFLDRVVDENRRLDGIVSSGMTRDAAHAFWRLGQWLERADMTTRVLGVRAAALLDAPDDDYGPVLWMGVLRSLSAMQMYQRTVRGPIVGGAAVSFALFDRHFPRSVAFCLARVRKSLAYLPACTEAAAALDAAAAVLARLERAGAPVPGAKMSATQTSGAPVSGVQVSQMSAVAANGTDPSIVELNGADPNRSELHGTELDDVEPAFAGRVLDAAMDEIQESLAQVHGVVATTYFG